MGHGRHHNNFDSLRLLAALQVATVHTLIYLNSGPRWLIDALEVVPGVPVFFVISGYLVSQSFERTSATTYFRNRAMRIYPALWGCLAISLILALAQGVRPDWHLWPWLIAQLTFVQFYNPDFLRGFGTGVLNGSLWTIPVELQFYLLLPLLYRVRWSALMAVSIASYFIFTEFPHKLIGVTLIPYLYLFLLGIYLQQHPKHRNPWMYLGLYIATECVMGYAGATIAGNGLNIVSATTLAFLVISLANTRAIQLPGDVSYGLYLYHMPIVNTFIAQGIGGRSATGWALLCSVVLAIASWFLIERWALKRKAHNVPYAVSSHVEPS